MPNPRLKRVLVQSRGATTLTYTVPTGFTKLHAVWLNVETPVNNGVEGVWHFPNPESTQPPVDGTLAVAIPGGIICPFDNSDSVGNPLYGAYRGNLNMDVFEGDIIYGASGAGINGEMAMVMLFEREAPKKTGIPPA